MPTHKHPQPNAAESRSPLEAASSAAKDRTGALGSPGLDPAIPPRPEPDLSTPPRLSVPDRLQLLSAKTIDDLLEPNHPARAVWSYVQQLDLTLFYDRIRARGSLAGRPAIDPRLLVALWLYATFVWLHQRPRTRRVVHPL